MSTTFALSSPTISCKPVSFLNAENAKLIDLKLMAEPGFSIDQLMELAGYSVACAAHDFQITSNVLVKNKNILVICGPGNNGGDGLVAARHLQHFGYKCTVVYPRRGKSYLFNNLVRQCDDLSIPVMDSISSSTYGDFGLIVDALFGFSFEGPPREPYAAVIRSLVTTTTPVLSVDVPSGWSVDEGDVHGTGLSPGAVISLSLPKRCMRGYKGVHYVGGRCDVSLITCIVVIV
jgi:NAD(P)H-hydrate epimerase